MKINELLNKRPTLSFEIFPPKNNENDITSIYATIDELAKMNPDFISVTYGANGSTSKNTCKIASTIKNKYGIESVAHLTCMNNTKDEIKEILEELKKMVSKMSFLYVATILKIVMVLIMVILNMLVN